VVYRVVIRRKDENKPYAELDIAYPGVLCAVGGPVYRPRRVCFGLGKRWKDRAGAQQAANRALTSLENRADWGAFELEVEEVRDGE
jgi:hypothetical protein